MRAACAVSAWMMPSVPAWNAATLRKADEKSSVISQCPRRSSANRPITVASSALAVTRLACSGQ